MIKLSKRMPGLKKLSKRSEPNRDKLIFEMKQQVKKDPVIIKKFKEYDVPLDKIDDVFVVFAPLDVSAKTKDTKIYLNERMLDEDSDVRDPTHYLVHELIHYLQQSTGHHDCNRENKDYLDLETEEEAFKAQVDFKKREESEEEAEDYVEKLLDHHEVDGKKRDEKKDELLGE